MSNWKFIVDWNKKGLLILCFHFSIPCFRDCEQSWLRPLDNSGDELIMNQIAIFWVLCDSFVGFAEHCFISDSQSNGLHNDTDFLFLSFFFFLSRKQESHISIGLFDLCSSLLLLVSGL